jgi:sulfoquinovosyltransferase
LLAVGQNLSQAFASADIFVLPSESETLGFVVLEAMASGVAPVAVAAGGVPGLIQHNSTGLLCGPTDGRDGTQFTAYVQELVENSKLRKKMAKAARKYAESLSWEFATNKLRSLQYPAAIEIHRSKNPKSYFYPRNETREHEILHELHEKEEIFDDEDI